MPAELLEQVTTGIETVEDIEGVTGVEPLNIVTVRYKTDPDEPWEAGTVVMRDDYTDQTYDWLLLNEGRWPVDRAIGVERITSDYYDIDLGDEVIFELDIGRLDPILSRSSPFMTRNITINLSCAYADQMQE